MKNEQIGWNDYFEAGFQQHAEPGVIPGRIALEHKNLYVLYTELGELSGEVSGRMLHNAQSRNDLPAVGDWVAMTPRESESRATIHAVLPRRSKFSRNAAGEKSQEQIVAANIDTIFLVMGLDANFNLRRVERYLILAWESGATPVIVLSKADLADDLDEKVALTESVAFGAPVVAVSATEGEGLESLAPFISHGKTVALIGSSGVGKSTLINSLAGSNRLAVQEISDSVGKGRHTTTHRELILLPSGGILMDTPGMREIQIWSGDEGFQDAFGDVEELAAACRFRDCEHNAEPGCAIRQALQDGSLNEGRFRNYQKLQREIAYQNRRQDQSAMLAEKERWKKLTKSVRSRPNRM